MASAEPKTETEGEANHLESKDKLTSVTNHEKFSVPEGHEVTVVQYTTNNAEAVVSVSSEDVNVSPPGKLISAVRGNSEEATSPTEGGVHAETGSAVAAEVPAGETAGAKETKEEAGEVAYHPANCLVDQTTTLINDEEKVAFLETATKDGVIVPGEPAVTPAVYRPKRPPALPQSPLQIVPSQSGAVHSSPRANGTPSTSDPNLKAKSMKRLREFRSSMRRTFDQVKGKLRNKRKEGSGNKRNTADANSSIHDGTSFYSSTDLYTSHPSSVTNTPQITRKEDRIAMALPDFQIAMRENAEGPKTTQQEEVLNWTGQSIAVEATQRRAPEPVEGEVQATHQARGSPQRGLLAQMTPGAPPVPPYGVGKTPTRPDTDHHNRDDPSTRRPATFWAGLSLDRRRNGQVRRHVPLEIRRTQTLRSTNYPGRMSERLRRYQPEVHVDEAAQPDGQKRMTFRTAVTERSDKVSWPFKTFSFRRNRPPKKVYATGQDPNAIRDKLRPTTSVNVNSEIAPKLEAPVHVAPPIMANKENPQRVSPPCLSRELTNANSMVTSLASHKRLAMLQQMSKGMHSEVRPVFHLVIHSDEPVGQAAPLPYFSDSLAKSVSWSSNGVNLALRNGVEEVHPFLAAWAAEMLSGEEAENAADMAVKAEVDKTCLQYFVTSCLKLHSADMPGEFAPFHYPLNDTHLRHWPQCVILDDCEEVRILREPQLDTEYLEVINLAENNVAQRNLFYTTQPIDRLLTAWLDCRSTVRASAGTPKREMPAYHPVQLVAKLNQLLAFEGDHNDLLDACLRLAVLLAYNYVKTQCHLLNQDDVCLDTDAKHITLFMTTTNCLVAFARKTEQSVSAAPEVPVTLEAVEQEEATQSAAAASVEEEEHPLEGEVVAESKRKEETADVPAVSTEQSDEEAEPEQGPATPVAEPEQPPTPQVNVELGTLLKSTKCDECSSSEEAIDSVIFEINKLVAAPPAARSLAVSLMRAVVPPDWMAMTLARVCIAKE